MSRFHPLSTVLFVAALFLAPVARGEDTSAQWKSAGGGSSAASPATADATPSTGDATGIVFASGSSPSTAERAVESPTTTNTTNTTNTVRLAGAELPADRGQVWREYDISPYTMRVTSTERPEQAVVDWILRETGYEAWHGETVSILSADHRQLRVYHTPEVQAVVAGIVDRFVGSQARSQAFGLRIVSISNPNWRAKAQGLLQPVAVQTPGVRAWILQKEHASVLLAELRRRNDYREHSSPYLLVQSGQSSLVNLLRPKTYVRDILRRPDVWPGYQPESGQIDEGLSLEFCPLLSLDAASIDATIKCTVTQVEKMVPVVLDVASAAAPNQRTKIEVPQVTQFCFHERFRWPTEQILLVSMGMVATPAPTAANTLVAGLPLGLSGGPGRADLLVMVEGKPQESPSPVANPSPLREARTFQGRY